MLWVTIFFAGWVLLFVLRGYVRGLWVSMLDLCGLLAGYVACFFWGNNLVQWLQDAGWPSTFALIGGYSGLFAVVNFIVAFVPKLVLSKALPKHNKLAWPGAGLGLGMGLVSGLITVWCFNFAAGILLQSKAVEEGVVAKLGLEGAENSALVNTANRFVGTLAKVTGRFGDAEPEQMGLLVAVAASPTEFTQGLQQVSKSEELKLLMSDDQVQLLMAENDVDALVENERFQDLMHQPGMQKLRLLVEDHEPEALRGNTALDASDDVVMDQYLAEQLAFLWRRVSMLKSDEDVQKLLQDRVVKKHIEERNFAALFTNRKIQKFISMVLEEESELEDHDYTQYISLGEGEEYEGKEHEGKGYEKGYKAGDVVAKTAQPQQIYRWVDDGGKVRYSEKAEIPLDRLSSAAPL